MISRLLADLNSRPLWFLQVMVTTSMTIYLWDGSEYVLAASDLDALTQYWFTDDGQVTTTPGDYDGITMFSIRGLELDAKLDPDDPNAFVTGLTFVQDPNEVSEVDAQYESDSCIR